MYLLKETLNGIFGYGNVVSVSVTNLVSSVGVVSADVSGVGTARAYLSGTEYGGDKGIFGYGYTGSNVSLTNLVSNAGVVAADVTGVGTARYSQAACGYGGDKGIFGFGYMMVVLNVSVTNLVSNAGVVATDVLQGLVLLEEYLAACEYGDDKGIFGYGDYW